MDTLVVCHEAEAITGAVRWVIVGQVLGPELAFEPRGVHFLRQGMHVPFVLAFTDDNTLRRARIPALTVLEEATGEKFASAMREFTNVLYESGYRGEAIVASAQNVWRVRPGHVEVSPHSYAVIGDRADVVTETMIGTEHRTPNMGVQGLVVHAVTEAWGTSKAPVCRLTRYKIVP